MLSYREIIDADKENKKQTNDIIKHFAFFIKKNS